MAAAASGTLTARAAGAFWAACGLIHSTMLQPCSTRRLPPLIMHSRQPIGCGYTSVNQWSARAVTRAATRFTRLPRLPGCNARLPGRDSGSGLVNSRQTHGFGTARLRRRACHVDAFGEIPRPAPRALVCQQTAVHSIRRMDSVVGGTQRSGCPVGTAAELSDQDMDDVIACLRGLRVEELVDELVVRRRTN